MVKLEWQVAWERWERPLLEPFVDSSEEESVPTVVKVRKSTISRKRKRKLVESQEATNESSGLHDVVSVEEKAPKVFVQEEEEMESKQPSEPNMSGKSPLLEERQDNAKSLSSETTENNVEEANSNANNTKDGTVASHVASNSRPTLWQRLCNTLDKRRKQFSREGFSPPGFVVDALPDLKVSLSIELHDYGYTKDSRKIVYPYDQHSKRFLEALDLGLIPPYEDLPTNHSFHYYQGCLIAEIRDFRSSFQGFLQTSMKASNKNTPVTYKLILRPDFHTILSDIDRAFHRAQCNLRMESDMKIQLELSLLTVLFRNIRSDCDFRRFYLVHHENDSLKWNRIRRPRMIIQDGKGMLCNWREFCHRAGYLSPKSNVLYICMMIESFLRKEKPTEGTSKNPGKHSLALGEGRKTSASNYGLPNPKNPLLPSCVDELAWKPFSLFVSNDKSKKENEEEKKKDEEEHRCALYRYKRNIYDLSKGINYSSSVDRSVSRRVPSRLRSDILRVLAFTLARRNNMLSTTKQVHCSFQIARRDNQLYYCESRRTYVRDNSMDVNCFTTCSLEYAMDFADNFRRICEFEGYVCILDSFRGPFERVRDNPVDSIPDKIFQKRPSSTSTNNHFFASSVPSTTTNNNNNYSSVSLAQPRERSVSSYYSYPSGNMATGSVYGKNWNPSINTIPQQSGSFYQGVQSEKRTNPMSSMPSTHQLYSAASNSSSSPPPSTTTTKVMRGPKPLVVTPTVANQATTTTNAPILSTANAVASSSTNRNDTSRNNPTTSAFFMGAGNNHNKTTHSPRHSSTSSFHSFYMQ